ncbi:hypothetical protein LCGC14_0773110 [marine sediment metagenome]|uniref:MYM-type domain-containing protein n=1 Tax=marine sediment metagenome TaxID=412755 RepID=A0A0F9T4K4_9ZZZZ
MEVGKCSHCGKEIDQIFTAEEWPQLVFCSWECICDYS